jgi:probable HAF family extracellular repeat protein
MLAAMVAVMPATANAAPPGQRYTWTAIDVPGSALTVPVAVNDIGVVVGLYDDSTGLGHGFIEWGGRYTTVNNPLASKTPPTTSEAVGSDVTGTNDLGEIVGNYSPSNGDDYGFVDQGGRFTTIEDPYADNAPGLGTTVAGVNDFGEIVGYYLDSDGTMHAFVYENGRYTTYTCPGAGTGPNSSDYDLGAAGTFFGYVDNAGAMIGTCFFETTGYYNFIYQNGRFNPVPNAPGSSSSWISWVTDSGESGGWYFTTPTVANGGVPDGYTYQNGHFTTIEDPAGPYGIYLDGANDFGQIAGYYLDSSGDVNGFLMTPSH